MSLSIDPMNAALGFHYLESYPEEEKNNLIVHNVANVLGYIPLIGTIVGLARMIFALYMVVTSESLDIEAKEYYRAEIYRGAVEFLSLGIMFVVLDIIVTRARNVAPKLFMGSKPAFGVRRLVAALQTR